ncbi:MAG TPA: DUF1572 family protein [Candidatus Eisenbacteria bacterium]|nr:DUF1572 family protein [Candidatus Eisenbacteria bacterium]
MDHAAAFLENAAKEFRQLKTHADRALAQVDDPRFFHTLDAESNSIAVICRHIAGNLISRWRHFLTEDGEKADRHRDGEFEIPAGASRAELVAAWEKGWSTLFDELGKVRPEDVEKTITIRGEPHTVIAAIHRQLTHNAAHIGQIVYLAKHLAGTDWQTISVPRGRSEEFNRKMRAQFEASR